MGRPPSSGYCHTCRKRRIKCDKTLPSCNRCLKSGYVCKGYELPLRMQCHVVVSDATSAEPGASKLQRLAPDASANPLLFDLTPLRTTAHPSNRRAARAAAAAAASAGRSLPSGAMARFGVDFDSTMTDAEAVAAGLGLTIGGGGFGLGVLANQPALPLSLRDDVALAYFFRRFSSSAPFSPYGSVPPSAFASSSRTISAGGPGATATTATTTTTTTHRRRPPLLQIAAARGFCDLAHDAVRALAAGLMGIDQQQQQQQGSVGASTALTAPGGAGPPDTGSGERGEAMRARGGELYGRALGKVRERMERAAAAAAAASAQGRRTGRGGTGRAGGGGGGAMLLDTDARKKEKNDGKAEMAGLVVPVMVLGMYAFSVERDLRFIHHDGVARLLQHCGPEYFQSEPLLTAFESVRAVLICKALVSRTRTFLSHPRWKTVPWRGGPASTPKSPTNYLLDILADIPGLVHDVQAVMRTRHERRRRESSEGGVAAGPASSSGSSAAIFAASSPSASETSSSASSGSSAGMMFGNGMVGGQGVFGASNSPQFNPVNASSSDPSLNNSSSSHNFFPAFSASPQPAPPPMTLPEEETLSALLLQVRVLSAQLAQWRWDWELANPGAASEVSLSRQQQQQQRRGYGGSGPASSSQRRQHRHHYHGLPVAQLGERMVGTGIRFDRAEQATEIALYNAVLIWLLRLEASLLVGLRESGGAQSAARAQHHHHHQQSRHQMPSPNLAGFGSAYGSSMAPASAWATGGSTSSLSPLQFPLSFSLAGGSQSSAATHHHPGNLRVPSPLSLQNGASSLYPPPPTLHRGISPPLDPALAVMADATSCGPSTFGPGAGRRSSSTPPPPLPSDPLAGIPTMTPLLQLPLAALEYLRTAATPARRAAPPRNDMDASAALSAVAQFAGLPIDPALSSTSPEPPPFYRPTPPTIYPAPPAFLLHAARASPLLLPGEARFAVQPAVELLRCVAAAAAGIPPASAESEDPGTTTASTTSTASTTTTTGVDLGAGSSSAAAIAARELVLPLLAPFGVAYCGVRHDPGLGVWLRGMLASGDGGGGQSHAGLPGGGGIGVAPVSAPATAPPPPASAPVLAAPGMARGGGGGGQDARLAAGGAGMAGFGAGVCAVAGLGLGSVLGGGAAVEKGKSAVRETAGAPSFGRGGLQGMGSGGGGGLGPGFVGGASSGFFKDAEGVLRRFGGRVQVGAVFG